MNNAEQTGRPTPRHRHSMRGSRLVAILSVASVLITGSILGQNASAAFAADYPSWGDVQKANGNVAAKQAEIASIDGLLASLASAVTTAQALADQKGAEFGAAQAKFDDAQYRSTELKRQADAAHAKADESKHQAGQLAARLARAGGEDLGSTLFFSGDKASDLLSQLGLASLVKDKSSGLYEKAIQDQNSAQSLTNQANVARDALKSLSDAAKKALEEAAAAAAKAADAVAEQESNKSRLEAQRQLLLTNADSVKTQYDAGVIAAAAAAAKAKAEAEAAAAAWAAAHPPSSGGGGGGSSSPSSLGWYRPAGGPITSNYGIRVNPVDGGTRLHSGTDLGAGCNSPIFAAAAGTVIFAGNSGGYGNMVIINHGSGLSTAYGHIVNGGTLVRAGAHVNGGQQIARVGSTGNSTGCHLHFETRPNGVAVDAVPFMRDRGIRLG